MKCADAHFFYSHNQCSCQHHFVSYDYDFSLHLIFKFNRLAFFFSLCISLIYSSANAQCAFILIAVSLNKILKIKNIYICINDVDVYMICFSPFVFGAYKCVCFLFPINLFFLYRIISLNN